MNKKTKILIVLVATVIVFLILIAAYDPLKIAVRDFMAGVGGGTFVALENGWSTIAANQLYQQLHVFIWFFAGMIVLGVLIIADRRGKIPLRNRMKTQPQPAMGQPQTILVAAAPAPTTSAPLAPGPTAEQKPPVDQNKTTGGT